MYAVIAPLIRLPRGRDWFDYAVPEDMVNLVAAGQIVDIPFRKRTIKGIVVALHHKKPTFAVRPIKKILTPIPFLSLASLHLAQSIAKQTATQFSIVLKSFLPVIKVRELAKLSYAPFETKSSSTHKPLIQLLHWSNESWRNKKYRERAKIAIDNDQSVLVITAREPDIHTLHNIFSGLPTLTVSPENRVQEVWEAWKRARSGEPVILIGLRSGVFAPFANLGLVIVDQEHDENLKQEEPNPRYHARSVAFELAIRSQADLMLASPVPSLESFYRAEHGIIQYYEEPREAASEITLLDLDNEHKKDVFSFIAPETMSSIDETLKHNKSIFILVDRLGAATKLTCKDCGYEWKCTECGAYMALHGGDTASRCQKCGETSVPPDSCLQCRGRNLKFGGAGTERIANLATTLKPDWPIIRLDSLTAQISPPRSLDLTKPAVIIGTRFALAHINEAPLGLAISLTTDQLLARPEFKTHEDTYRMLSELARRAGRLLVYTRDANHWVLQALTKSYREFYNEEARVRQRWGYPPYTTLTRLILQDPSKTILTKRAAVLARKIKFSLPTLTISDPYELQPARVRGRWRMGILLKSKDPKTAASIDWNTLIDADTIVDVQPNSIT